MRGRARSAMDIPIPRQCVREPILVHNMRARLTKSAHDLDANQRPHLCRKYKGNGAYLRTESFQHINKQAPRIVTLFRPYVHEYGATFQDLQRGFLDPARSIHYCVSQPSAVAATRLSITSGTGAPRTILRRTVLACYGGRTSQPGARTSRSRFRRSRSLW